MGERHEGARDEREVYRGSESIHGVLEVETASMIRHLGSTCLWFDGVRDDLLGDRDLLRVRIEYARGDLLRVQLEYARGDLLSVQLEYARGDLLRVQLERARGDLLRVHIERARGDLRGRSARVGRSLRGSFVFDGGS